MKSILGWIKSNLLTVGSVVLVLVALVGLWFVYSSSVSLEENAKKRVKKIDQVRNLGRQNVEFPSDDPKEPMKSLTIAVNKRAVDRVRDVRSRMNAERDDVVKEAMKINQGNHRVMLDGLFPKERSAALPYDARDAYRKAFKTMLEPYSPDARYPTLNAGPPPDFVEISDVLAKVEQDYLQGFQVTSVQALDVKQQQALRKNKQKLLLDALQRQARKIHVYAQTDEKLVDEFPFELGSWSTGAAAPLLSDIWHGQMELWIQQDIVQAIAQTNQVHLPTTNVMTAPVKRLLKIEVYHGYVGLHDNEGGIREGSQQMDMGEDVFDPMAGGGGGFIPLEVLMGGGGNKKNDKPKPKKQAKEEEDFSFMGEEGGDGGGGGGIEVAKIDDKFYYGPTGRASNDLYDVWHARVSIMVDYRRLPQFFDQLKNVNFMSVLKMEIKDVDEYEELQQGYVYGSDDVVQVDMLIESLWLRDWTLRLMPQKVKEEDLGIEDAG